jgi:MFS family permease
MASDHPSREAKPPLWTSDFIKILVTNCVVFVSFQMLIPILPLYVTSIGGNEATVGFVVGALTFAVLIVRPFAGWLVDQWGRQVVMILSISIFAITGLMYPFAASIAALLAIRVIQGIGWSGVNPSVSTIVVDLTPPRRLGEGLAYQSTSQSLAMAIGPAISLFVLRLAGFAPAFLLAAALGFLALILSFRIRYPQAPRVAKKRFRFRDLIEISTLPPSAITALTTFLFGGLTAFVPLAAIDRDLGNPATFFITFAVGLVIIRPITGRISDISTQRGMLLFPGLGLIASSVLVLALTQSAWTLVVTGLSWAAGFGITQPVLRVMAIARAPRDNWGAANATIATAYEVGMGLGASVLGILASQVGIFMMFALSALAPVVAAALVFAWRLHHY